MDLENMEKKTPSSKDGSHVFDDQKGEISSVSWGIAPYRITMSLTSNGPWDTSKRRYGITPSCPSWGWDFP
jgi:hypothetical protein